MIKPKNTLILYQHGNRKGRRDGDEFRREAKAFQKLHGGEIYGINHKQTLWKRARWTIGTIDGYSHRNENLDCLCYMGHGSVKGFPSLGISLNAPGIRSVKSLVDVLVEAASPDIIVCLYSCLSGKKTGVADWMAWYLRSICGRSKARVMSHSTRGHVSFNPYAEWCGEGTDGTGIPIIPRHDPLWPKWRDRLREDQTFRLSFPFLTVEEIRFLLKGQVENV